MILKSFGCSFIFGTDLPDSKNNSPSNMTWPALLAHDLGIEYCCLAQGGVGNFHILNLVLEHANVYRGNELFVLGWTFQDRFDYVNRNEVSKIGWETIRPALDNPHAEFYYRNLHSEFQDKMTALIYMYTALQALQSRNIPFVMTAIDQLPFERAWHQTPGVQLLQDQIAPHVRWFNNTDFLSWAQQQQYPISDTMHPLTQAHAAAAAIMRPCAEQALYSLV